MNKSSKIYVAGHNGLVGSAIVRNLQSKGYTNIIFVSHQQLDLTNQQAVADFFQKEKPEYVVLAAAKVGGIVANNIYRADFIYVNLQIQNNVIHQSYVHGVKKLLFLGSSCIYPKLCPQPMKEEYLLTGELEYTNEPYAISKIAGLKMCDSYNLQYGTNFIAVMPTNLYGPQDNFNLETSHVLPAIIRKMHLSKNLQNNDWNAIRQDLNKRPIHGVDGNASEEEIIKIFNGQGVTIENKKVTIKLWGSGTPRRELLHSNDLAEASVFILENIDFENVSAQSGKEKKNLHINIGTGIDTTIKELSDIVQKVTGFEGEVLWDTTKPDGTMKKLLDISKVNQLGWKPNIKLEEGIKSVYADYIK